jgi:hypothetical protein
MECQQAVFPIPLCLPDENLRKHVRIWERSEFGDKSFTDNPNGDILRPEGIYPERQETLPPVSSLAIP